MSFTPGPRELFVDGRWIAGEGLALESLDPDNFSPVWSGFAASTSQVDEAVTAAHTSGRSWRRRALQERLGVIERFASLLRTHHDSIVELISRENGKPLWDAAGEVAATLGKVEASVQALRERASPVTRSLGSATVERTFRPHGPMAVIGPFNFPLLLPAGHIIPALLAGNTVVFKPSEQTPAVASATVALWEQAGAPQGVINLVHGGSEVAAALIDHPEIRGVLFTGGIEVGLAIRRRLVDRPEIITALELGGNNPIVVWDAAHLETAARIVIGSAFISSGQRCLCARRLVVANDDTGRRLVERISDLSSRLRTGKPRAEPQPFNGPLISSAAVSRVLAAQDELIERGGEVLVPAQRCNGLGPGYLQPGIIDVTDVADLPDREVFGPLLCVLRVDGYDEALAKAQATRFGLAAALVSDRPELFDRFVSEVDAGLMNFNTPTVNASGWAPFGGAGWSGNHRPSGFFAADYCAWPTATIRNPAPADGFNLHGIDDRLT